MPALPSRVKPADEAAHGHWSWRRPVDRAAAVVVVIVVELRRDRSRASTTTRTTTRTRKEDDEDEDEQEERGDMALSGTWGHSRPGTAV